jgi:hypothetical protein
MFAPNHNTTAWQSEQATDSTHSPARNLASIWGQGRRQITPWASPRLRGLAALRFAIGFFLVGLGAVMISYGHPGLAAIPLAGAALNFSIASLDITAARSAPPRA